MIDGAEIKPGRFKIGIDTPEPPPKHKEFARGITLTLPAPDTEWKKDGGHKASLINPDEQKAVGRYAL